MFSVTDLAGLPSRENPCRSKLTRGLDPPFVRMTMAKVPVIRPLSQLRSWARAMADSKGRGGIIQKRIAERMERILAVAERTASLELRLLERLEPIVDNLGELVRMQLEEARAARAARNGEPPRQEKDPRIIDVEGRKSEPK